MPLTTDLDLQAGTQQNRRIKQCLFEIHAHPLLCGESHPLFLGPQPEGLAGTTAPGILTPNHRQWEQNQDSRIPRWEE